MASMSMWDTLTCFWIEGLIFYHFFWYLIYIYWSLVLYFFDSLKGIVKLLEYEQ